MKNDNQIQMAFVLWQNMVRLETVLWEYYDKEFLKLLLDSRNEEKQKEEPRDFMF